MGCATLVTLAGVWDLRRQTGGILEMYVEYEVGGRILAAYLEQQYSGQRWLPISSRALQAYLAAAPTVAMAAQREGRLSARWINLALGG